MKKSILILGSGKMARNIGASFLKKNYPVYWVSENRDSLLLLQKHITKEVKRLHKILPHLSDYCFNFYDYSETGQIPPVDIILESTAEDLEKKQRAIYSINHLLRNNEINLLSTSSSLLPEEIHPSCIGCHFFFPVELTGFVELIFPAVCPDLKKENVKQWLNEAEFSFIEQSGEGAFAANRLLLPIQSEAFRLLKSGYDPQVINRVSSSNLLPAGLLTLMDNVGLDVIYAGAKNYVRRMPETIQADYSTLINGLEKLLSLGKLGKKNKNGLLFGQPLPWPVKHSGDDLSNHFLYLFINTCKTFIKKDLISLISLEKILSSIFQSEISFEEKEKQISEPSFLSFLDNLYSQTPVSYFKYLQ